MKQRTNKKSYIALGRKIHKTPALHRSSKNPSRNKNNQSMAGVRDMLVILENMPVMLAALGDNLQITFWNHEVERQTGYSSSEIKNNPDWLHYIFPDSTYRSYIYNKLTQNSGEFRDWEWEIVCKDGSLKTFALSSVSGQYPIPGWKIWVVAYDVSHHKKVEDDLREALVWSNSILETSMSGYYSYNLDGKIITCNEAFCQQTGYSREELLSMLINDLQYDFSSEELEMQRLRVIENGRHRFEAALRMKNDTGVLLDINASFLFTDDGGRFVCFARDITRQRKTEEDLRQSQEAYRLIAENVYDVIWSIDLKGNFSYISPSIERLSGYTIEEMTSGDMDMILPRNTLRSLRKILKEADTSMPDSSQTPHRLEFQLKHKNGSFVWVEILTSVLYGENGACFGILSVIRDIHQRKLIEISEQQQRRLAEALASSASAMNSRLNMHEVLKQILVNIGDVVSHDSANFSLINPENGTLNVIRMTVKAGNRFDISEKEIEMGLDDLPNLRRMYNSGQPLICPDTQNDPNWVASKNVSLTRSYAGVPVRVKGETVGFLNLESYTPNFFHDEHAYRLKAFADQAAIAVENARLFETALKQLIERERIARSEHEQRILAEALRASAAVLNSTLNLDEVLKRILEEAGRVVPHDISDIVLLDDNHKIVSITTGKGYPTEDKNFASLVVNQSIDHYVDLQKVFETRQPLIIDDVRQFPGWIQNTSTSWKLSQIVTPIFVQDEIVGFINLGSANANFFNENLSERLIVFADHAATAIQNAALYSSIQQELRTREKMQETLLASQKLAALGTLAAGIAHEINSPLQTITGLSDSILSRLEKNLFKIEDLPQEIEMISRNSWRVARIVQSILNYARASKETNEAVNVNQLIVDAMQIVEEHCTKNKNMTFLTNLSPDLPAYFCDSEQISLVLVHLLSNACDSMPLDGQVSINSFFDADQQRIILKIKDTGMGIDTEIQDRIFDPFFTTKPVGQGTGLGLAISMSIIHAHNGDIQLESAPGKGSTFTLSFPINITSAPKSQLEQYGRYSDSL